MRGSETAVLVPILLGLIATASPSGRASDAETEPPRDVGLVEQTGRDLVQIDLSVHGPPDTLEQLTAQDFEVTVGGQPIEHFALDRLCRGEASPPRQLLRAGAEREPSSRSSPPSSHASYVFYFDHFHLTMDGQIRSIELARELARKLLGDGSRAMLLSAATRTEVLVDWTEDPAELLAGLDRLARDPSRYETYADAEEGNEKRILGMMQMGQDVESSIVSLLVPPHETPGMPASADAEVATQIRRMVRASPKLAAVDLQRRERSHTAKALERLSALLSSLSGTAMPKAVIYFADTVRPNPGDHYVEMFGTGPTNQCAGGQTCSVCAGGEICQVSGGPSLPEFDQVIDDAAINGVRLYTVQGRGLIDENGTVVAERWSLARLSGPMAGAERFTDAKNGLVALAAETGGRAFLNGAGADQIVSRIEGDLGCVYLISFPPGDLPRDRALGLSVRVTRPGVSVTTRGRVVVQSPQARREARLTRAFLSAGTVGQGPELAQIVIPTGFAKRSYSALVQVVLPADATAGATWDVGVSLTTGKHKAQQVSGRVGVQKPGVRLIFETELEFPPGPYELTAVARDTARDVVVSSRTAGTWPDPNAAEASVGPLALLQPASAAFVRGDQTRLEGSLGVAAGEWIDPALPTALVGIVCRGRSGWASDARVERRMVGETEADFEAITPEPSERCALFSDEVPPGMLTSGSFSYEVVLGGEQASPAVAAEHRFVAVGKEYWLARSP